MIKNMEAKKKILIKKKKTINNIFNIYIYI